MSFTLEELRAGTAGRVLLSERTRFPGASIDSRSVGPGEVFFALSSEKRDGHDFVEAALAQGV
ncbi:MAG: Mur ligase domain-containing protein, partial [Bdellovibrionota bacterium]